MLPATNVKVSSTVSASIVACPEIAMFLNALTPVRSEPLPANDTAVNAPVLGLYVNPVSVSAPCVPVAPSTKTG